MRPVGSRAVAAALAVGSALMCGAADAAPMIAGCPSFPANNIWNARVNTLPVDANSNAYVAAIGADKPLKADFGSALYEGAPIGIPYIVVPFQQQPVDIVLADFDGEGPYPDQSDIGPAPIPANAPVEGGPGSTDDRHVIVVEQGSCMLFELYKAVPNGGGSWNAVASARFNLKSNDLRPDGWTSTDAAGLPVFSGLARWEEVAAGEIAHALRFTAPRTAQSYVWPARHFASDTDDQSLPPMGQRFRLKASVDISGFSVSNRVILRALQTYGMILADNGSPWFVSGAPDEQWNDAELQGELRRLTGADFEAVDTSSLMVDPDSATTRQ